MNVTSPTAVTSAPARLCRRVAIHKVPKQPEGIVADGARNGDKLDKIEPAFPAFILGDKGLRIALKRWAKGREDGKLGGSDDVRTVERREREKADADKIQKLLSDHLDGYSVECGKNLLYKIEIEAPGRLSYDVSGVPMRGQHAFQTDLLITKGPTPLVAIELKSGSFSSHDVITYSAKAERHKRIYPYLRYGFVVIGLSAVASSLTMRDLTLRWRFPIAAASNPTWSHSCSNSRKFASDRINAAWLDQRSLL